MGKSCFSGLRKGYLRSQMQGYITASKDNRGLSEASNIVNRFLRRFPLSLPDTEDPTEEELAAVNDNVAHGDEEDTSYMNEEEEQAHRKRIGRRVSVSRLPLFTLFLKTEGFDSKSGTGSSVSCGSPSNHLQAALGDLQVAPGHLQRRIRMGA